MHAVIFEVWPHREHTAEYFDFAAALKGELETMPGFISVERFESLTEPGKFLSLSFWDSDEAIANWRRQSPHRRAQAAGRGGIFADYRLRVAAVVRDYGMSRRDQAPDDSRAAHEGAPVAPAAPDGSD